jgi:hypothetical protein
MSQRLRAPPTFKRTDVVRALRAAAAAGIDVGRIEIDRDGKIVMVMTAPATAPASPDPNVNEWDAVK